MQGEGFSKFITIEAKQLNMYYVIDIVNQRYDILFTRIRSLYNTKTKDIQSEKKIQIYLNQKHPSFSFYCHAVTSTQSSLGWKELDPIRSLAR